jgi:hypothetical protein
VDLPHLILHGLSWLWPGVGLTALIVFAWALRRPAVSPIGGGWGACGLLGLGAVTTQAVALWGLRWPDGSMATYGALIVVLATLRVLLGRPVARLS